MLTHGSLFAGIGGFDLGFERAGIRTVWQVEIDPYCRHVLEKHFPHAQRYADIRECGAHNLAPVDILSGGFPCQDISNAGKRAGIDGERSGLWSEYARIVGELRPRYVVVENVAALLGRGMGRVLGDLAACGYDAEWQSIRASDVGAPHRRERIWIVAHPGCLCSESWRAVANMGSAEAEGISEASKWERIRNAANNCSADVAYAARKRMERERLSVRPGRPLEAAADTERGGEAVAYPNWSYKFGRSRIMQMGRFGSQEETSHNGVGSGTQWRAEPNVGRVAHGIPARVDRLKGLGNAVVPQIAEWIGRRIVEAETVKV